jgi:hypothetical protein
MCTALPGGTAELDGLFDVPANGSQGSASASDDGNEGDRPPPRAFRGDAETDDLLVSMIDNTAGEDLTGLVQG